MSHFCSTNDCFVTFQHFLPYAISRHDNILHIAIARCLNDEKVGAVKIAGQENVSRVYPFFFFFYHIRNGVLRPPRIPKGNYSLVTTVGTTFYAITRLCFTAGALTHLPGLICDVYRFITRRHLFDNVVTDYHEQRPVFVGKIWARPPILSIHHLQKGRITSEENHG